MSIRGVWHFSFHVSDMEQSLNFYQDLLGFELVHRQAQENDYTRKLVGYDDASLLVAQLKIPGQPQGVSSHDLELVQYVTPQGEPVPTTERHRPGVGHLAIAVSDALSEYERLSSAGVRFVSEPLAITAGVNKGGYCCYFVDPDGCTLELVQPPNRD